MNRPSVALPAALLQDACQPYRVAGRFAYQFARGKLGGDPAFRALLELGLLQGRHRILDLGCGQGLLAAWLRSAEQCAQRGDWPSAWPPPPGDIQVRGIELMPRDVERARQALRESAEFVQGDICEVPFGEADAVVILDVLHYLAPEAQRRVLERVRQALPAQGLLLLRVGDAAGGLGFHFSQWVDRTVMAIRGHGLVRLHCQSVARWLELLAQCGFAARPVPMSEGTPFANVLLVAHAQ